jgi:hypothetical protein
MRNDPTLDDLKKRPECDAAITEIERKYWKKHAELKEKWGDEFSNL